MNIPKAIEERVKSYSEKLKDNPKLQKMYENCYLHTISSVVEECDDGSYFVLTGDIPAMWLRDTVAQITHYIKLSKDKEVAQIIEGVIKRLFMYIPIEPYANAFNKEANGYGHTDDMPMQSPWVWERKYEIDSLCYPIRLLYLYWKESGNDEFVKENLEKAAEIILDLWITEQHHVEKSPYRFVRMNGDVPNYDSLPNDGLGAPVKYTGMTWSGYRPSDDRCEYGYLTASEMFAVVVLGYMAEMLKDVCKNDELYNKCIKLRAEIDKGIKKYCITDNEKYGKIYVCETDGMGNYMMIDDANIPSLLSIPYIGYEACDSELYKNTRSFLLSKDNPYYFEGKYAKGIGSPHTPNNYVWHMALVMQGMTATDKNEKLEMLNMLLNTDADTGYLHEGFDVNDPYTFTREWFTWPNSLFAEYIEQLVDENII